MLSNRRLLELASSSQRYDRGEFRYISCLHWKYKQRDKFLTHIRHNTYLFLEEWLEQWFLWLTDNKEVKNHYYVYTYHKTENSNKVFKQVSDRTGTCQNSDPIFAIFPLSQMSQHSGENEWDK